MNILEELRDRIGGFDVLCGYQLALGLILVFAGIVVALFPVVLVALVSGGIMAAGLALIASAWRGRRPNRSVAGHTRVEVIDW